MFLSNSINKFLIAKSTIALLAISLNANSINNCEYKTFDIQINDSVTIIEAVNQISQRCNLSVSVKDAQGNALLSDTLYNVNLKNTTLDNALKLIVGENNIFYSLNGNILQLSGIDTKTFFVDYITSVREGTATLNASVSNNPVEEGSDRNITTISDNEIKVREQFDFWQALDAELEKILNNGSEAYNAQAPIINHKAGLITVTATSSQLKRVEEYLDNLKNRLHKQVLIDVSIIEVKLSNSESTGINWNNLQLNINGGVGFEGFNNTLRIPNDPSSSFNRAFNQAFSVINASNFSFDGILNFLKTHGETKVVSNPKVLTMNNQQALITVGDNVNYSVAQNTTNGQTGNEQQTFTNYSIFIGVLLNLLPSISNDGKIMLRINPSVSNFVDPNDAIADPENPRKIAPDTKEKKLSTVAMVNSNDTIILGGLIDSESSDAENKVPLLGDIPLLGNLFKGTTKSVSNKEIIFIITPRLVEFDGNYNTQSLKDLGYSKSFYEEKHEEQ